MHSDTGQLNEASLIERYQIADRSKQWLRVNFISSLDGAATQNGRSGGLGNAEDQKVMGILRMLSDVVLVGAGTLRVEGYGDLGLTDQQLEWRVANGLSEHPVFATASALLDLDPASRAFADAPVRPIIFTGEAAPEVRRREMSDVADVVLCGTERAEPRAMLAELARRGLNQVLCEGGPHLFGALVHAECVDELCLSLSPVIENGTSVRITAGQPQKSYGMKLAHAIPAGDMLLLRYVRPATAG